MSMDPKQKPNQTPEPRAGRVTFDLSSFNILLADDYDFMQALTVAMLKEFLNVQTLTPIFIMFL